MFPPIDGVIFDVDGTLWDAAPVAVRGWNQAIQAATGIPNRVSIADAHAVYGLALEEMAARLFPEMEEAAGRRLLRACFRAEDTVLSQNPPPLYPGAEETLRSLAKRWPLYIVSNCQKGYIELLVHGHHLEDLISGWLCWGDTREEKDVTLRALMARHGLKRPVYVGDTRGDQLACQRVGIPFVFASYGFGSAQAPLWTLERFGDLEVLLSSWAASGVNFPV